MANETKIGQRKIVSYCGVGAVCRAGDECFVICDTNRWVNHANAIIGLKIPIIRNHLKCRLAAMGFAENIELRIPPILKSLPGGKTIGSRIPAVRFPSWMVCLKCRRIHYLPWVNILKKNGERYESVTDIKCNNLLDGKKCNGRLEFVQYVLVHENGYLDDIPWEYLLHRNKPGEPCGHKDDMYLKRDDRGRLHLQCGRCKHQEDIGGIKDPGFWGWLKKMNNQPWLREVVSLPDSTQAYLFSITDVNVHIPRTVSALDIPPESDIDDAGLHSRLQQDDRYEQLIELRQEEQHILFDETLKRIAREFSCKSEILQSTFDELQAGWPNLPAEEGLEFVDDEQMKEKEFMALCEKRTFEKHARFVTENITEDWKQFSQDEHVPYGSAIKELVLVKKLKEIQVFAGFSRFRQSGVLVKPDLTGNSNWLPACELYGEGLFFSLDEELMQNWENIDSVKSRASIIEGRRKKNNATRLPVASPRLILLHTLSHLIIKELEFVCGYPVSSIKERIFCSPAINGILIYIAVPNKFGSLGGLVDQCKPKMFNKLFSRALDKSYLCSYDPICAEHEGQGDKQLNRAACHGCLLLPEISCENKNCLLDRKFLIGDEKSVMPGLIKYISGE